MRKAASEVTARARNTGAAFHQIRITVDGKSQTHKLLTDDVAAFNKSVREANVPAVFVPAKAGGTQ